MREEALDRTSARSSHVGEDGDDCYALSEWHKTSRVLCVTYGLSPLARFNIVGGTTQAEESFATSSESQASNNDSTLMNLDGPAR